MTTTIVSVGIFLTLLAVAFARARPLLADEFDENDDFILQLAANGEATHPSQDADIPQVIHALNKTSSNWARTYSHGCISSNKLFGGRGGRFFSYGCPSQRLTKIEIWYKTNGVIRGLRTNYGYDVKGVAADVHSVINLKDDENIVAAIVRTGDYYRHGIRVRQLAFLTMRNGHLYQHGPYGGHMRGGRNNAVHIITKHIVSFKGRKGRDLDAIGFYYRE